MYKPFLEHLETELNRRFSLQRRPIPEGLELRASNPERHPATIQSWCYQCPELRKVRYTYIDAGETSQILNSVIYPSHHYDLPLLGVDFLSFGKAKNLVVMDFQPLFQEAAYLEKYTAPLKALHDRYPDLNQGLEMKSYDANQYFSKYLLFAKTDPKTVQTLVFEAFKEYLQLYLQLLDDAKPLSNSIAIQRVRQAQKDYDQYSAERDPAAGLFKGYFGHDWAERFLYEFLFEEAIPLVTSVR
ncbi:MAG: 15,16-dihydrobiliverdin:ferredoxin oxidoreductase [Leptolyngbyaceae cyanobacterium]